MSRPTTTCSLVAIGPLFSSSWLVLAAYHQAHVNHKKCHSGAVSGWKQCWWKNEACLSWYPCLYYLGGEEQKNFLQHMQLYCFSLSQIPDSIFHGFPFPRQWSFFSPCWLLTSLLSYLIRLGCSGCAFLVVRWWFVRWVLLCLCKLLFMVSLARAICFFVFCMGSHELACLFTFFYFDPFLVFLLGLACWGLDVHGSSFLHGWAAVHCSWLLVL